MGTRERHIGHAAARTAPVADPRGGRLFAMPRFLVGITHQVYRHRVFAIAGAITALFLMLLAVLPALFAFDPKLSNAVPAYSKVSEEVVDALAHSSSLPLLVAAIVFSIWGVSVYLRCLDYVLRRRLVAVATICALWMIEVILKYKSFTPFYATVLWYLYYVPMTLIPLLYQLCGLRLAGLEQHRLGRRYCAALWIAAILLIGFVLTNDFHQQVFRFDRTSDTWSNDYTYGWGYFAVLVWTAFDFVAFFYPGWSVLFLSHPAFLGHGGARTTGRRILCRLVCSARALGMEAQLFARLLRPVRGGDGNLSRLRCHSVVSRHRRHLRHLTA